VVIVETVAEAAPAQPEQTQDTTSVTPAPTEEAEQSATRICPKCGAVVSATAHFCIVCGTKID
jgi:ribosomal protein L40E